MQHKATPGLLFIASTVAAPPPLSPLFFADRVAILWDPRTRSNVDQIFSSTMGCLQPDIRPVSDEIKYLLSSRLIEGSQISCKKLQHAVPESLKFPGPRLCANRPLVQPFSMGGRCRFSFS